MDRLAPRQCISHKSSIVSPSELHPQQRRFYVNNYSNHNNNLFLSPSYFSDEIYVMHKKSNNKIILVYLKIDIASNKGYGEYKT